MKEVRSSGSLSFSCPASEDIIWRNSWDMRWHSDNDPKLVEMSQNWRTTKSSCKPARTYFRAAVFVRHAHSWIHMDSMMVTDLQTFWSETHFSLRSLQNSCIREKDPTQLNCVVVSIGPSMDLVATGFASLPNL